MRGTRVKAIRKAFVLANGRAPRRVVGMSDSGQHGGNEWRALKRSIAAAGRPDHSRREVKETRGQRRARQAREGKRASV